MKRLTIIACIDSRGLLGVNGKLPWSHPEEMNHFKEYTKGKTLLMGSNTFYSLKRPLEDRVNVVVSSDIGKFDAHMNRVGDFYEANPDREMPLVIHSLTLEDLFQSDLEGLGEEIVCIGGGKMYQTILPYATNLIITRLHNNIELNSEEENSTAVYFPQVKGSEWKLTKSEELKSSIGTALGIIMHLETTHSYENVHGFKTKKPLTVEEYFCAMNGLESNLYQMLPIDDVDEVS